MTAEADSTDKVREAMGDRRSLIDTWTEVVADASGLVRAEARLARVETATNLRALVRSSVTILLGLVLTMVAVTFFSVAAVVGLASFIGLGWALVSVAASCVALGVVLILLGQARMGLLKILPDQSIRRVSADLHRLSLRGRAMMTSAGDPVSKAQGSEPNQPGSGHPEHVRSGGNHETP